MGFLKKLAWMIAAGPIMILTAIFMLVVGSVYLVLGGVAFVFFCWTVFWGIHWAVTHNAQSGVYCAVAFAGCAIPGSLITLLTFGLGSGVKGTVTGLAAHGVNKRRRVHIHIPVIRPHRGKPALRVVT